MAAWKTHIKNLLLISGGLTAVVSSWALLKLPVPAWSDDILRLDKQQIGVAIQATRADKRDAIERALQIKEKLIAQESLDAQKKSSDFISLLEKNQKEIDSQIQELDKRLNQLQERELILQKE